MEHPIRVAFCPILYTSNGGQLDNKGKAIVSLNNRVRGKCDKAFDCGDCFLLQNWIATCVSEGWIVGWECDDCLHVTKAVSRQLPGFFQEGRLDDSSSLNIISQPPSLSGCTRCKKETSFLQLVLRR